jgi:hypothetical protein
MNLPRHCCLGSASESGRVLQATRATQRKQGQWCAVRGMLHPPPFSCIPVDYPIMTELRAHHFPPLLHFVADAVPLGQVLPRGDRHTHLYRLPTRQPLPHCRRIIAYRMPTRHVHKRSRRGCMQNLQCWAVQRHVRLQHVALHWAVQCRVLLSEQHRSN